MADALRDKSIHELRQMAQAFGVSGDLFSMGAPQLVQAIEQRQQAMLPEPAVAISRPEYDARLMTKAPSRTSSVAEIVDILKPYTERGLHLEFMEDDWRMRWADREDTGTIRQPLRVILGCAERIIQG